MSTRLAIGVLLYLVGMPIIFYFEYKWLVVVYSIAHSSNYHRCARIHRLSHRRNTLATCSDVSTYLCHYAVSYMYYFRNVCIDYMQYYCCIAVSRRLQGRLRGLRLTFYFWCALVRVQAGLNTSIVNPRRVFGCRRRLWQGMYFFRAYP